MPTCPFCSLPESAVIARNTHCLAFRDRFPVSPGHTLIIPRRHASGLSDLTPDELSALFELVPMIQKMISREFNPDGFNIGINDGRAAGQTVMHLHLHVIPRHDGDVDDPRGGVRWVLPDQAVYWEDR